MNMFNKPPQNKIEVGEKEKKVREVISEDIIGVLSNSVAYLQIKGGMNNQEAREAVEKAIIEWKRYAGGSGFQAVPGLGISSEDAMNRKFE